MTDYGPQINPIFEAWEKNPDARAEFARLVADRYQDNMDEVMRGVFAQLTARTLEERTKAYQMP